MRVSEDELETMGDAEDKEEREQSKRALSTSTSIDVRGWTSPGCYLQNKQHESPTSYIR
jgi:hypothetical protein